MIGTIVAVLGGFTWMVVRSYRQAQRTGGGFQPEGKLRWTEDP